MGEEHQPLGTGHRRCARADQQALPGATGLATPECGHFPGSDRIEFLHPREQNDAEGSRSIGRGAIAVHRPSGPWARKDMEVSHRQGRPSPLGGGGAPPSRESPLRNPPFASITT